MCSRLTIKERKKERNKENKVLIFAEAPFSFSKTYTQCNTYLYMTIWFT